MFLYKLAGYGFKNVIIEEGNFFGNYVLIGEGSYLNRGGYYLSGNNKNEGIIIGKNCYIGTGCIFSCFTHEIGGSERRAVGRITGSIQVGDGVWIGLGVKILPNIKIGAGCVIGAGAVVVSDLEPNSLYVGVPAKKVRELQ